VSCESHRNSSTAAAFEATSKRKKGYPSEARVKRGSRVVHGDKELMEKLGRNDPCPCNSGRRFQELLHAPRSDGRREPRLLLSENDGVSWRTLDRAGSLLPCVRAGRRRGRESPRLATSARGSRAAHQLKPFRRGPELRRSTVREGSDEVRRRRSPPRLRWFENARRRDALGASSTRVSALLTLLFPIWKLADTLPRH